MKTFEFINLMIYIENEKLQFIKLLTYNYGKIGHIF